MDRFAARLALALALALVASPVLAQPEAPEGAPGTGTAEGTSPAGAEAETATGEEGTASAEPGPTSGAVVGTEPLPLPPPLDPPLLPGEEEQPVTEGEAEEEGVLLEFEAGEGVLIATPDRAFEMNIRSRGMLLLDIEIPEETNPDGSHPDPVLNLDVRRARLIVSGRIFDRHIRYRLQLGFAPRDMNEHTSSDGALAGTPTRSPMLDWYVEFQQLRELHVRVGQYVLPYNRSRVTSSSSMQLVDRSLANGEFHLDRDLGIQFFSPDVGGLGLFRYYAGIFTNEGRDGLFGGDFGFLYLLRAEVLPLGLFNTYTEGDVHRTSTPRLAIGASYAFADDSHVTGITTGHMSPDDARFDYHNAEVDVMFNYAGLSLTSEFMWREGWRDSRPAIDPTVPDPCAIDPTTLNMPGGCRPRNGVGWYFQAGYLLPMIDLEIAGRYGFTMPIGPTGSSATAEHSELGLGANYYFHDHAFKLQVDYFRLWDDADFSDGSAIGIGEDRIRVMFQASL